MNIMIIQTEENPIFRLCIWDNEKEGFGREIGIPLTQEELLSLERYISDFTSGRMKRLQLIMDDNTTMPGADNERSEYI